MSRIWYRAGIVSVHDGGSEMLWRGLAVNVVGREEESVAVLLLSNISTVVLEGSVAT